MLICGASFARLSTAYWLSRLGYEVTVVEIANGLKKGGTPVDIRDGTINVVSRMGLLDAIRPKSLPPRKTEFRNADDKPDGSFPSDGNADDSALEKYEIERDVLLDMLFNLAGNRVEFMFGNRIVQLVDAQDEVKVTFEDGSQRAFSLVFGCDGNHSTVRRIVFADEAAYSHFLGHYFSVTILDTLLIEENTTQIRLTPLKFHLDYSEKRWPKEEDRKKGSLTKLWSPSASTPSKSSLIEVCFRENAVVCATANSRAQAEIISAVG